MAALSGLQVDNAIVEIDGPEVPIMDGSAAQFVDAIDSVGAASQSRRRRYLKVLKPLRVESRVARCAELRPAARGFQSRCRDRFRRRRHRPAAARLRCRARQCSAAKSRRARTFGFVADVKKLWQAGFALGLVAGEFGRARRRRDPQSRGSALRRRVRSAQGARRDRRSCRWRAPPIVGAYHAYRPGHTINAARCCRRCSPIARPYEIVEGGAAAVSRRRRRAGRAGGATAFAANAD